MIAHARREPRGVLARRLGRAALAAGVCSMLGAKAALAVRSIVWTESPSGLLTGRPASVSLTPRGAIVLAPTTDDLGALGAKARAAGPASSSTSELIVWCEALDAQGNLYLGTGHSGRVLKVTPRGEITTAAELEEPEVTAILASSTGAVYVGTSPNGAVYRLGQGGAATTVFHEPEERYIWALAEDASGALYVGTGETGKIFKVSPKGEGAVYYDFPQPHVTSLVTDRSGSIVAATAGGGVLYRIDPSRKATALYDSAYEEIVDVAIDASGTIYAAAVAAGVGEIPAPAPRLRVRPAEDETPVTGGPEELAPVKPSRRQIREKPEEPLEAEIEGLPFLETPETKDSGGGSVLRISRDGSVDELWRSGREVPYTLTIAADGSVLLGTGEPARLLRLEDGGRASVVASFPQAQLSRLIADSAGRVFAATSNSGAAYRISPELCASGTYESPVRDGGVRARWGKVRWEADVGAGQKVEVQTRSGNTNVPDETWSDWSPVYASPEGSDVLSTSGRYLQWRTRLVRSAQAGSSPVVRSVAVSYLPWNRPPRIQDVKLLTVEESRSASSTPGHEELARAGRPRTIVWHAEDPDEDRLVYSVWLQQEGGSEWTLLAAGLSDSRHSFDESGMTEGRYRIKTVASDAPSNVPVESLSSEMVSDPAVIDHSPPQLDRLPGSGEGGSTKGPVLVRATDALSPIAEAELREGDRVVSAARAADGVLDSRIETLEVDLPQTAPPGGLRLVVKDASGNEASLQVLSPLAPERRDEGASGR